MLVDNTIMIAQDIKSMKIVSFTYDNDAVHLTIDTGECLIVPASLEYNRFFSKDLEIDENHLAMLREAGEIYLCTKKAVGYLARGSKSQAHMVQYLKKKKFQQKAITGAVEYARSRGYIDDTDYAVKYVTDLTKRKAVGSSRIKASLHAKGVSREDADKALSRSGFVESWEDALAAARKKIGNKGKTPEKDKLWRFLRYRGFSDDSVRKVMKALEKEGIFSSDDNEGI